MCWVHIIHIFFCVTHSLLQCIVLIIWVSVLIIKFQLMFLCSQYWLLHVVYMFHILFILTQTLQPTLFAYRIFTSHLFWNVSKPINLLIVIMVHHNFSLGGPLKDTRFQWPVNGLLAQTSERKWLFCFWLVRYNGNSTVHHTRYLQALPKN